MFMHPKNLLLLTIGVLLLSLLTFGLTPVRALTNPVPTMGTTAITFAVLGASTVTNTGSSVVNGNLGVSPGSAVTGFPPGIVTNGTIHVTDATAATALAEATTTFNNAGLQPCDQTLTGQDLGGLTLTAKVYCFASTASLTGPLPLTLSGPGIFVFKIGTALDAASGSQVIAINGADPCTIFWQVGSAATLNTASSFIGNILAGTSINLFTGATSNGGLYALTAAVTLQSNAVQVCSAPLVPPTSTSVPPVNTPVPPTSTPLPPVNTAIPPTSTPLPPVNTPIPPTNTSIPPVNTAIAVTNTPIPPVNTPVPPTSTPIPPVNTPVPPTSTSILLVNTAVPPASTPIPPNLVASTSTAMALNTETAVALSTSTAVALNTETAETETAVALNTETAVALNTSAAVAAAIGTETVVPTETGRRS